MARKSDSSAVVETLRTIPLFHNIRERDDALHSLAGRMKEAKVGSGKWLLKEGEMGQKMFILKAGTVEVCKTTLEKEQYTVAALHGTENAFFGELALLDEDRRSASIRTVGTCTVFELTRKDFEEFGNEHPDAALFVMRELAKIVCRRFRATNRDVVLLFSALVNEVSQTEIE